MDLLSFPELTREDLAELGGWTVLRKARALHQAGAVEALGWEKPVLTGRVREGDKQFEPVLDLRSLTFPRNRCQCAAGRGGQPCAHAVALCIQAQKMDRQQSSGAPAIRKSPGRQALPGNWMVVDGSPKYLSILLREKEHPQYARCVDWLKAEGFRHEHSNGKWWLRDQHKVLNFLATQRKRLDRDYDAGYTDGFRERTVMIAPVAVECRTSSQRGGFSVELELKAEGIGMREIHDALVSGCHYIVHDERIHLVEKELLEKFTTVSRSLGGNPDLPMTGLFQAHVSNAELADTASLLDELDLGESLPDDWTARSAAIREVGRLEQPPLTDEMAGRLRTYQLIGVAWLWHLYRHQLGGVLADEMGLGKTIQAIGLIRCWKSDGQPGGPVLVVVPASLLGNWRRELERWAPGIGVYLHHGPDRLRECWTEPDAPDVCLTSYGTLRNDMALFAEAAFSIAIADEAQHVKNRRTHASRSLRAIQAASRFVLTGTPIENTIDDLRSLFAFCLPGYLKRPPADARGEDREWFQKRDLEKAAPYILRRGKKAVAPELPDKIEQTVWCGLSDEQAALYRSVREKSQQLLMSMAASGASENRLRFTMLTELLRLRQVCADPGMLDPSLPLEGAGKFQAFQELLEEALDGSHRILVFSQFVKLLKRLRAWLEESGIPCGYIDGSTRDRLAVCDRFNNDPAIPVCLVSLKAGGTGLNLTGADTVIHFDPWWNPAVEDQATDRAHRIGQTRTVTSYKLVTEGTVEDKVVALQAGKAALLRDLLDESALQSAKVDLDTLKGLFS
jgi:superfamily II DNA or RNA helicase